MEIDLTAFHFLRPVWLLLLIPAFGLPFVWLRRNDVRARWRGVIAPELLEHLIVGGAKRRVIQPVHTLALLLGIGALAVAGPTWQQERPPFNQDKAPLVVVLELAHSMDATDIAPTRLERAKRSARSRESAQGRANGARRVRIDRSPRGAADRRPGDARTLRARALAGADAARRQERDGRARRRRKASGERPGGGHDRLHERRLRCK